MLRTFPWFAAAGASVIAACATGTADEATSSTDATATGQGGSPAGTGGATTTSSTSSGDGGAGAGPPMCDPPQKLCGGVCVDGMVANGCSASAECLPCPEPTSNGFAVCDAGGACAVECDEGYDPQGSECVCPGECCDNSDCASSEVCADNTCTTDCSQGSEAYGLCVLLCVAMNQQCRTDGVCECE